MNLDTIHTLDAHDQARLVRDGEVTARELVEATLARIAAVEPLVHAVVDVNADAALARAEVASGPLGGVPMMLKDSISYPGLRWTLGMRAFADRVADEGSPYTTSLDAAGLVVVGKTAMSELGLTPFTESLLEGPTRNPWDLMRSALGSSGGSAVAVATGMVPVAHGSDGGGSLRLPASACGVFGFKPSSRRTCPTGPDLGAMSDFTCDHVLSRSVRDSALLLALTESPLSPWPTTGLVEHPSSRPLRIGVYRDTATGDALDDDVEAALVRAAALCASLGHDVVETRGPAVEARDVGLVFFSHAGALLDEIALGLGMMGRKSDAFEPWTRSVRRWFRALPPGWVMGAEEAAERVRRAVGAFLLSFDVTLCPTTPFLAPPLGAVSTHAAFDLEAPSLGLRLASAAAVHNIVGAPAMSVPLGVASSSLPIGMMFAAPPGEDRRLLELAFALEEAAPWPRLAP